MRLKEGDTGVIKFGNGTSAKVVVTKVQTYSTLPADIYFTYQEGETNKQIKHPEFGETFPLPEGLVDMVFTKD